MPQTSAPKPIGLAQKKLAINGGTPVARPDVFEQWPPRDPEVQSALLNTYHSGEWAYMPEGIQDRLASEFAAAHGAQYGLFLTNGTTALLTALTAIGITAGDEVIVPGFTCPTTVLPILMLGAKPVFADCDPHSLCIDPLEVARLVSPLTKALIAVHMYTAIADMDALTHMCDENRITLIEDCAHLPGAAWRGRPVGSFGAFGCFSFQFRKTISAGEGGMMVTNDPVLFDTAHRLIHVGKPYAFETSVDTELDFCPATNASASSFQAAVVLAQFQNLKTRLEKYQASYDRLKQAVNKIDGVRLQDIGAHTTHQSFFKLCFIFEGAQFEKVSIDALINAAKAEGLPLKKTYGAAYLDIRLKAKATRDGWQEGRCPIAENIAMNRTAILDHWFLSGGDAGADFTADVLKKQATLAETIPATLPSTTKHLFSKI